MRALIIGCGYLGARVAARWRRSGHLVSALTRSPDRAAEWQRQGIDPVLGDVLQPETLAPLPESDVLLYAVGYDRAAGADRQTVYVEGLRHTLAAVGSRTGRVIYISSTSVYGQDAGEWVDEAAPAQPQTDGGRICLAAEELLRASRAEDRFSILRLSGIYGPGRLLARVEALRQGTPLAGSANAWLNLIHVDDAVSAVLAAAAHRAPERMYLVSDDSPVTRGEYYGELARLSQAPPPIFDASQLPRHGTGLNKRCRSDRVKASLGITWRYPSCREGLPSSLD